MKISKRGIELIKSFEGLKLNAYKPIATEKYYTIGFGHYGSDVRENDEITEQKAIELLKQDLVKFERGVTSLLRVRVNQNQFDALVSFAYNVGVTALKTSTLLSKLNRKDFAGASVEFDRWNKAGGRVLNGLVSRRKMERILFETPVRKKSTKVTHKIVSGDNLTLIAKKYKTSVSELLKLNPQIKNKNMIYIGQSITIRK